MNIVNLIRRWPVASYFILVFLISWGGSVLLGLGDFISGAELELVDVLPMAAAMLGAPLGVGFGMVYLTRGKEGVRDLLTRMARWRVNGRWYLTLLIFPILILAVLWPLARWVNADLAPTFFVPGIIMGLSAGFLEESGWMGFAYPQMRLRLSPLRTSIYLGVIHAIWHAAADFMGNYNEMANIWLLNLVLFGIFIVALRVIIAWVYENTESVLLSQLLHASSTGFLSILLTTNNKAETWPVFYGVYAVVLWLVAAFIIVRNRESMTDQPVEQARLSPSW